jgi:hypothetical protein
MRILFDQGVPNPLRHQLQGHQVSTAYEMGWSQLKNGDLLDQAEAAFDVLVTTDQNLHHQQNLTARSIAILVLATTSWPIIRNHASAVLTAIDELKPGEYRELVFAP